MSITFEPIHDSGITLDDCFRCSICKAIVYDMDTTDHKEWHEDLTTVLNAIAENNSFILTKKL